MMFIFDNFSVFSVYHFPFQRASYSFGSFNLNHLLVNGVSYYYYIVGGQRVTLLQSLDYLRVNVPRFCYHEALNVAGNCRMCLVAVSNSIKPVISCSTLLSPGMEVITNSFAIRRYRKSILEFLLINHPLDCPVCDQAGKCDLQDLAFVFGHDVSRFSFNKRVVYDISFNSLVKTVMVRCIHCTRCIRFLTDVLFVEELGMMGRGSGSIISTFVNKNLKNSLVSNVIDLCPVGALVSKVGSGSYRSWEKESSYFIDILDPFLKPISVELCGNRIVDILPVTTTLNSFISDRTRYLWQSLQAFRSNQPVVYFGKEVHFSSQSLIVSRFFYSYFSRKLLSSNSLFSLSFLDLKDTFFCSFLLDSFFGISSSFSSNTSSDSRSYFTGFDANESNLVAGVSLDQEAPMFVPFLNRVSSFINDSIFVIDSYSSDFFNSLRHVKHIGSNSNSCTKLIEGRLRLKNNCIISPFNVYVNESLFSLFNYIKSSGFDFFSISFIRGFGSIHKEEIGDVFSFSNNTFASFKSFVFIQFFGSSVSLNSRYNSLYNFGLHTDTCSVSSLSRVDVGLYSLFEKAGKFISLRGILKQTSSRLCSYIRNLFTLEFWIWKICKFFVQPHNSVSVFTPYSWVEVSNSFFFSSSLFDFSLLYDMDFLFSIVCIFSSSFLFDKLFQAVSRTFISASSFYLYFRPDLFTRFFCYRRASVSHLEFDVFSQWSTSLNDSGRDIAEPIVHSSFFSSV